MICRSSDVETTAEYFPCDLSSACRTSARQTWEEWWPSRFVCPACQYAMSLIFYPSLAHLDLINRGRRRQFTVPRRLILHFKDFHFMHQTAVLARSAVPTVPYRSHGRSVAYQLVLAALRHVPGPDTIYRHVPSFGTPTCPTVTGAGARAFRPPPSKRCLGSFITLQVVSGR